MSYNTVVHSLCCHTYWTWALQFLDCRMPFLIVLYRFRLILYSNASCCCRQEQKYHFHNDTPLCLLCTLCTCRKYMHRRIFWQHPLGHDLHNDKSRYSYLQCLIIGQWHIHSKTSASLIMSQSCWPFTSKYQTSIHFQNRLNLVSSFLLCLKRTQSWHRKCWRTIWSIWI